METFAALLALCAGNSRVTGEFPSQKPVTRSFDIIFDLRLNKRLSKQSWGWWFETPSRPLWRHYNVMHNILSVKRLYSYNIGLCMDKYSNQLLHDVFDIFSKHTDVHEYNARNASLQPVYVCFQGKTRGQKRTLIYCGTRIWNYIHHSVDSKCAIASIKKRIQRLFLFSNDDFITWFRNT